jgi:hypothetical protein
MLKAHTSNHCYQCSAALFTVISGSYRKHLRQIVRLKQILEHLHVVVLSPSGDVAVNPDDEFIILDSDPVSHPKLLQDSVFAKIRRSTFLTVANVRGYLGCAAVLEIGYAIGLGISIYTLEPIEDPNLAPYCTSLKDVFPEISLSHVEETNEDLEFALQSSHPEEKVSETENEVR